MTSTQGRLCIEFVTLLYLGPITAIKVQRSDTMHLIKDAKEVAFDGVQDFLDCLSKDWLINLEYIYI